MHSPSVLADCLSSRVPGHGLPRPFLIDPEIYCFELETIWRASWLYAGPSAEVAGPGNFFTLELDRDSIIIVRDDAGDLHALHNTCRHRGMPVCAGSRGTVTRWVCPYHQWSYALDGRLLGAGGMERELDLSGYDLRRAAVVEIGGLVFVRLGDGGTSGTRPDTHSPPDIAAARLELEDALASHGLARAKIAHQIEYSVAANWKLVWENNRECWHCHVGHPDYVKANFDASPDTQRNRELARSRSSEHARVLAALAGDERDALAGAQRHSQPGLYRFPTSGRWWSANRTPMAPGYVTESLDGAPVAPLMGDYPGYDVGTLRVRTVPNFWCHASADHAVLTRLLPNGPGQTKVTVQWLVDARAEEGRDYTLERLLPFWQLTSEQDWSLCERNQRGVSSPAFVPGPYSPSREYNVIAFVDWYLGRMQAGCSPV
jgi:Rieske 2Fe-2S family protein